MLTAKRADDLLREIAELYATVLGIARRVNEADEPMTATQRLLLIEVAAAKELRPRELARLLHTTPATITRAVDALEAAGLVERKEDPSDGRCRLVKATDRGLRWTQRRSDRLRKSILQLPSSAAPAGLVKDLARLNDALRTVAGDSRHTPRRL